MDYNYSHFDAQRSDKRFKIFMIYDIQSKLCIEQYKIFSGIELQSIIGETDSFACISQVVPEWDVHGVTFSFWRLSDCLFDVQVNSYFC